MRIKKHPTKVIGFSPSGSGGLLGGSKNKKPKEEEQDTFSNSYAEVIGMLSEGPIEGLIDGAKSIFLDDTPIENANGSKNFTGFSYEFRHGTQFQDRFKGFADNISSETSVGVEVKRDIPITRRITNKNLDVIRVRVSVLLQEYPEKGGVVGSRIAFKIFVQEGSGSLRLRAEKEISGRYASPTEFEYAFPVDNDGGLTSTFIVKVERTTAEPDNPDRIQKQLNFQSYTEVVETKLNYPNTALVAMKLKASQFSSAPKFSFLLGGRRVAIPSNASVASSDRGLNFSGTWNGTFTTPSKACSDPVWILWDLLTNKRYGLGNSIQTSNIDKWALYAISRYCNEMVPDGFGGTERRFSCNVLLDGKEEAFKVIDAFRSIFRGFAYYLNGAVSFVADMPTSPTLQFTQADIVDGMFSYARTGLKARHTVALVTWIDPEDNYSRAVEVVEDPEGISIYGVRTIEVSAFACTSRGQARRAGLAILFTERLETETVTFKVRAFGCGCVPGMVIKISDSKRAQIRYGGIVADYTTDINNNAYVEIDHPVTIVAGVTYTLTCMMDDGSIQERTVINGPGTFTRIYFTPAFNRNVQIEGNWIISTVNLQPQLFRVLNRSTIDGSEGSLYEITALQYEPGKYNAIEQGLSLSPRQTRQVAPSIVSRPRGVSVGFQSIGIAPDTSYTLSITWQSPLDANGSRDAFVTAYLVEYKKELAGDWTGTVTTPAFSYSIPGLPPGSYYARVASLDIAGNASTWVETGGVQLGVISTRARFNTVDNSFFVSEY